MIAADVLIAWKRVLLYWARFCGGLRRKHPSTGQEAIPIRLHCAASFEYVLKRAALVLKVPFELTERRGHLARQSHSKTN